MATKNKNTANAVVTTTPTLNKHNIQANRYYIFSETGNLCVATTADQSNIQPEVAKIFQEVAVFFAGMTRAITTTINAATKKPYTI